MGFDELFDRIRHDVSTASALVDQVYASMHAEVDKLQLSVGMPKTKGTPEQRIAATVAYIRKLRR